MAVNLSPIWGAGAQLLDNSGNVLSGGKIYTYAAGTTTQVATYTSNNGNTANSNPIILNSAGRVPYELWLTDGQNYKFVLKDSNDVLIGTWDNLSGINSNFVAYTNQQEIQTATAGQTVFNLITMQYLPGTNNLSVFVDGVNQYGPGAQYAFEETDQTTVTFVSGLHVGAEVKFTSTQIQNAGVTDATQISYEPPFTGAVAESVADKLSECLSVKDFGAVGDGVTDDTAAIQLAAQSLTGNQTLYFPDGTYLISYIWTPYSDSDTVNGIGRGRGVIYLNNVPNINLYGPRATIKCVDHDIATYGGFTFAWVTQSPGFTVDGFNFDMTFIGYNNSASYYPMCGAVFAYDPYDGSATQTNLCSNFTAQNLTLKLYHPLGAFAQTSHPYGSDNNNGYKILGVTALGDNAATAIDNRNKNLLIQNIRFLKGHNAYGTWGYAYDNATFKDIVADAWVASYYVIDTATNVGVNFISPVRFYQYACEGLTVDNIQVMSLPWSERTGAFVGYCGGVSVESGLTNRFSGGGVVTNCTFVLADNDAVLGGNSDVGIRSSLSGNVRITNNSFGAWSASGVVAIYIIGEDSSSQKTYYTIDNNISSKNINGPFIQLVNVSNTAAANRSVKDLVVSNNVIKGWGSAGALFFYKTGYTYYGCEKVVVTDNIFDGSESSSSSTTGTAVKPDCQATSDQVVVTNNIISYALAPINCGNATSIITDNLTSNISANGNLNYLTNYYNAQSTFTAGQNVTISIATGDQYSYTYNEYSSTGTLVYTAVGVASSTTGTIRTVAAGNTGYLIYKKIGTLR